jgi:hypothetical protein
MPEGGPPLRGSAAADRVRLFGLRRLAVLLTLAAAAFPILSDTAAAQTQAPVLSVDGQTIRWQQVGSVTGYLLATKVPGSPTAYSRVTCTTPPACAHTPAAVPGTTVTYGMRTDVSGSAWADEVQITYARRTDPPVLRVSGDTITWDQVADVTSYVTATKVPGQATVHRTTTCSTPPNCSWTPQPVPGQTVTYGLRTAVTGSTWAVEVSISYAGGDTLFGISSTGGDAHLADSQALGAKARRMYDTSPGTSAASLRARVGAIADRGMQPVMLANWSASMPTDAEAANLGNWAREFGPGGTFWQGRPHQAHLAVRWIEFGNEVSYAYRQFGASSAGTYARKAKIAADAIRAANPQVKLAVEALVSNFPNWIQDMRAAVPDLDTRIGGWIVHPYGPASRYTSLLDGSRNTIRNAGWQIDAAKPFVITEDGIATHDGRMLSDNYGWPRNMTFAQAGSAIEAKVADMTARWPVGVYLVYQARDQRPYWDASTEREHWFGVLKQDGSAKGVYTDAVRRIMALRRTPGE